MGGLRVRVTSLELTDLAGTIPPELGDLTGLETLSLSGSLSGPIPPELGNLARLTSLELKNNQLTGGIPPELGNLVYLEKLSIDSSLSGPIPPELGNLTSLASLGLRDNQFTGGIPPQVGKPRRRRPAVPPRSKAEHQTLTRGQLSWVDGGWAEGMTLDVRRPGSLLWHWHDPGIRGSKLYGIRRRIVRRSIPGI